MNFSRSALYDVKTRVCLKYFVNHCRLSLKDVGLQKKIFLWNIKKNYRKCYFCSYWYALKYFTDYVTERLCNCFVFWTAWEYKKVKIIVFRLFSYRYYVDEVIEYVKIMVIWKLRIIFYNSTLQVISKSKQLLKIYLKSIITHIIS